MIWLEKSVRLGKRLFGRCLSIVLYLPLSSLKRKQSVPLFMWLAKSYVKQHSPAQALRFLFELDEQLYSLQGQMSVAYEGGLHSKHRHIRYHDFFVDRISKGERVLDVGCGVGAVAYDVAEKAGGNVVGIDLNQKNIRIAKERFSHPNIQYLVGDVLKDVPDKQYDLVIMSNVLEHLPQRVLFLRQLVALTAVRRILLRVPLFERDWRVPLKKELGMEWRLDPTHYVEYSNELFEEEMKEAALGIKHMEIRWGEIWAEVVPR